MTEREVNAYVIRKWIAGHSPDFIKLYLLCLGHPISRNGILLIIRKYIDIASENKILGAGRVGRRYG